jgi:hypothetical protein
LESGKVKGKMMYLEVHKSVVVSEGGKVLGVCGSGRILTDYIKAVKDLENSTLYEKSSCCAAINNLLEAFKVHEFEEE